MQISHDKLANVVVVAHDEWARKSSGSVVGSHPYKSRTLNPSTHPTTSSIRGSFSLFTKQHVDLIAIMARSQELGAGPDGECPAASVHLQVVVPGRGGAGAGAQWSVVSGEVVCVRRNYHKSDGSNKKGSSGELGRPVRVEFLRRAVLTGKPDKWF